MVIVVVVVVVAPPTAGKVEVLQLLTCPGGVEGVEGRLGRVGGGGLGRLEGGGWVRDVLVLGQGHHTPVGHLVAVIH